MKKTDGESTAWPPRSHALENTNQHRVAKRAALAPAVDIIVPVYKGLDDTRRCIESVLRSTTRTPFRLIAINDFSPEADVTNWLRGIVGLDDRYLLLENEKNLGFVGTVNRGMALSDQHDVVLLNSDAEVANDWLDRLRRAAYSDAKVASVTPFSNNATICSYPRFCSDNPMPHGFDTARLDALFANIFPGEVVDIPTGIGFCMYIRRDCLIDVGLFDEANFGKGYGEENDFCCRAAARGWRNLHALDVFAKHAGGVSFGATKSPREQAAMETLRRLHPGYELNVHRFLAIDPARLYRQRIDIERVRTAGLPVVLAVLHDRGGGTKRHVDELAEHLRENAIFLRLQPAPEQRVILSLAGSGETLALAFRLTEQFQELIQFLQALGVRHVHFHHVLGHGEEVRSLPKRLGTSFDFTAHDFYVICPQISLTDKTNGYCGEQGVLQCTTCLQEIPAPGGLDIQSWRTLHRDFLSAARYILAPSADSIRRLSKLLPSVNIRLARHPDMSSMRVLPKVEVGPPLPPSASLRVAVIGAMSIIKGADVLDDTAYLAMSRNVPVEFHLIGYAYRSLRTSAKLIVHGEYDENELAALLEQLQPDIVWFPAQWPETYSYTLSACLLAGLPIAAPDLGAFPERLSGRPWSWVQPWNLTAEAWLAFFEQVRAENFATGVAPPLTWRATDITSLGTDTGWSYLETYLDGIPTPTPTLYPLEISIPFLSKHQLVPAATKERLRLQFRDTLLMLILRIRALRILRPLVRAVPLRWQVWLKSKLRA